MPFAASTCGSGWGYFLLDPQRMTTRCGVVGEAHPVGPPALVVAAAALGLAEVRCCNTMVLPLQRVLGELLPQLTPQPPQQERSHRSLVPAPSEGTGIGTPACPCGEDILAWEW